MLADSWSVIEERLRRLGVQPGDLLEQFVRSGGKGGQNVNKVATCVILRHGPSGVTVRCEEERSQAANRLLARKRLAARLEALERERVARERDAFERARRRTRGRSRAAKNRMLHEKKHRAAVKKHRRFRPDEE